MFQSKNDKQTNAGNSFAHNSLIHGTTISGNITSRSDIRIDGHLQGNLTCESKVVIGEKALIEGCITSKHILLQGQVVGNIYCTEKLHILNTGKVEGDIHTSKLVIDEGATFNGASVMGAKKNTDNSADPFVDAEKETQNA